MMDLQTLINFTVFDLVKAFLVIGLVMYTAFAIVIIRQVMIMSESIADSLNSLIILFAWVHLAIAVFLTIVSVIVL